MHLPRLSYRICSNDAEPGRKIVFGQVFPKMNGDQREEHR